jgi:hypothetical protein
MGRHGLLPAKAAAAADMTARFDLRAPSKHKIGVDLSYNSLL